MSTTIAHTQPCGCTITLGTAPVPGKAGAVDLTVMGIAECSLHQSAQALYTSLKHVLDTLPAPQGDNASAVVRQQARRTIAQVDGAADPVHANAYRLLAAVHAARRLAEHHCSQCQRGFHCPKRAGLQRIADTTRQDVLATIASQEAINAPTP